MKERLSREGIPIHTPTDQEKARGAEYLVCLRAAMAAKAMTSSGEFEIGENLYGVARQRAQRMGFSGYIFDQVVDYKIRLEKEREQNGKK